MRLISSQSGWNENQPAMCEPACSRVYVAFSWVAIVGVPAASAISCAWHDRSIVMNHHAASSTE